MNESRKLVTLNKNPEGLNWTKKENLVSDTYSTELEEVLIKKYMTLKADSNGDKRIRPRSEIFYTTSLENSLILVDALTNEDSEKTSMLLALCPSIKSVEAAKFYLEASHYDVEQAEKLYNDQINTSTKEIVVNLKLPNGVLITFKFNESDYLWEIGQVLFEATEIPQDFRVFTEDATPIPTEDLASMTFSQYGFTGSVTLIIEFL